MLEDMNNQELALEAQRHLVGFEAALAEGLRRAMRDGNMKAAGKLGAMQHVMDVAHKDLNRIMRDLPEVQIYFGGDK